ncbi:uncharacterized protein LOC126677221 [Mercurialis annua]|uniref:uncharacterized protein LOC126677221 n=1 Tax=Mercurialis annua TaxID=3986 RepID=UPI00215E1A95|nr:uncharacterized protein LOC126677221 [Mercurialis annua]
MKAPQNIREVQKLNGRITALGRFISSSAKKRLPFFKQLRNIKKFTWDEDCQKAFENLKSFLTQTPLLSRPIAGEMTLKGAELNYPTIDKLALAVVVTTKKLKPYFQGHIVIVRTNQPLRKALHRPETSGRLVSWSVQLGVHDIRYEPRKTLKAQALADFVAEMTEKPPDSVAEDITWNLFVDGASSEQGAGAGIVLLGPQTVLIEHALHLKLKATNNMAGMRVRRYFFYCIKLLRCSCLADDVAEYEAFLTGLTLAKEVKAERLRIHSDSQLVTSQILGQFQTKDANMAKYMERAKVMLMEIERNGGQWEIIPIPRERNMRADALAKAAATRSSLYLSLYMKEERMSPIIDEKEILPITEIDPWMQPIVEYLNDGTVSEGRAAAAKLVRISSVYSMIEGTLYRISVTHPWSKCISVEDGAYVLKEIHEGERGAHEGPASLSRKALLLDIIGQL